MVIGETSDSKETFDLLVRKLPASQMVFPEPLLHRIKYALWYLYTPSHPFCRDTAVSLGIVRHEGRQDFLLGTIAPDQSLEELVAHLVGKGYGNHFVAWKDEGEILGLRYVEDFVYQYHLRIFEDGEVRGHYEFTPECYSVSHMLETGQEDRREYFLELLGHRIIPAS